MPSQFSTREIQNFSTVRLIDTLRRQDRRSSHELECSQQYCRSQGIVSTGDVAYIPPEMAGITANRNMAVGTATAGGYTVGNEVLPIFHYVYGQSVVMRLGAQVVPGLKGDITVPTEETSTDAEWLAEQAAATPGSTTYGASFAKPRRVVAVRKYSTQSLGQLGPAEENIMNRQLGEALAAAIDKAVLVGNGGAQPLGLLNDSGVVATSLGVAGGAPTWTAICNTVGIPVNNRFPISPAAGWAVSPEFRNVCSRIPIFSNTSIPILHTVVGNDYIGGLRAYATDFMPDNGVKSSGTSLGSAIFGADWSTVLILAWGGIELIVDRFTYARAGAVEVQMTALLDVVKARPTAFAKIVDAVTT